MATDLICQLSPAAPPLADGLAALELLATEVAPALGWSPAAQRDGPHGGRVDSTPGQALDTK